MDLKNGVIYFKSSGNSIVHGNINITNGSKLESSQSKFLAGDVTLFNTGLQIYNQSEVRGGLIVNNSNIKFVDLKDSEFYGPVTLDNKNYSVKILNNNFYHIGGLRINAVKDFDIFDNNFFNCDVCLRINGEPNEAKNLFFKNKFEKSRSNGVSVLSSSTGLALECNTMTNSLTRDWNILAAIAPMQGDPDLAAGNLFSRAASEVEYNVPFQVIYRYNSFITQEKPINITGNHANLFRNIENLAPGSKCLLDYPQPPIYPAHCTNGVKDQNELAIDCGGSCKKCNIFDLNPDLISFDKCSNGVKDGDETGKDCGGKSCPPCDTCNDGVQNNGENGVDCGGSFCPPCNVLLCSNGLLDTGEQSTDCGGVCPPCTSVAPPTCHDGLQNQNETGTDCGGICPPCGESNVNYLTTCYNSIKDGTETDIDCGGSCHPCDCTSEGIENDYYFQELKRTTDQFMSQLQSKYGSTYFLNNEPLNASKERTNYLNYLDGGNTSYLINLINSSGHTQEQLILSLLNDISPFVSEKAIHTLFGKSDYFSQSDVADVVRRNPAVLRDRYINSVVNNTNSFSQIQIDNINNAASAGDARTEDYEKQRIRSHYMHQLVRNHLAAASQGLTPDFETIRCQLLRKDDHEVRYQVYQTFIDEGQYNFATIYLDHLDPQEITDPFYRSELYAFKTLNSILMNYYFAGNKIVPIPESTKQNLLNLASGCNGIAGINAAKVYNELFRSYIAPTLCIGDQSLTFKSKLNSRSKLNESIYVKPNPASDEIEIWNEFGKYDQNLKIKISDINGNQVYHENLINKMTRIDISQWNAGMYMYMVYNNQQVKQSSRFIKINK